MVKKIFIPRLGYIEIPDVNTISPSFLSEVDNFFSLYAKTQILHSNKPIFELCVTTPNVITCKYFYISIEVDIFPSTYVLLVYVYQNHCDRGITLLIFTYAVIRYAMFHRQLKHHCIFYILLFFQLRHINSYRLRILRYTLQMNIEISLLGRKVKIE